MHFVSPAIEGNFCPCEEGNPAELVCDCKGCMGHGICSHVLCINHILKRFNVREELRDIGKSAFKRSGNKKRVEPALLPAPVREPDSSDEEDERLLQLGQQGR